MTANLACLVDTDAGRVTFDFSRKGVYADWRQSVLPVEPYTVRTIKEYMRKM